MNKSICVSLARARVVQSACKIVDLRDRITREPAGHFLIVYANLRVFESSTTCSNFYVALFYFTFGNFLQQTDLLFVFRCKVIEVRGWVRYTAFRKFEPIFSSNGLKKHEFDTDRKIDTVATVLIDTERAD
jgi:hypothetical protein